MEDAELRFICGGLNTPPRVRNHNSVRWAEPGSSLPFSGLTVDLGVPTFPHQILVSLSIGAIQLWVSRTTVTTTRAQAGRCV